MSRVLVVGSGAREHALAWKLAQSSGVEQVYLAPGNGGTETESVNLAVKATDSTGLLAAVERYRIDLIVIGPEAALASGIQTVLRRHGHAVVGPEPFCFQLEASKAFAKRVMTAAGVPTARAEVFTSYESAARFLAGTSDPVVVKADGLAAGKGVSVCQTRDEALAALRAALVSGSFGEAGATVLIEELLDGPEVSLMCLVDSEKAIPLPVAQDHKRLLDGDRGPNTGGMGAYAPVPFLEQEDVAELVRLTINPVIAHMRANGHPYRGVLFAGLMLTESGPKVLEYNCRFGDPETQAVLPLIDCDLFELLTATATGTLPDTIGTSDLHSAAVVLATPGYPEAPVTGQTVEGLKETGSEIVFHAGTSRTESGEIVTSGGRALTVVGTGPSLAEALETAYPSPVRFEGMQRRSDIGASPGRRVGAAELPAAAGNSASATGPNVAGGSMVSGHRSPRRATTNVAGGPVISAGDTVHSRKEDRGPLPVVVPSQPPPASNIVPDIQQHLGDQPKRPKGLGYELDPASNAARHSAAGTVAGNSPCRIVVMASGGGSNLQALINAQHAGLLKAFITGVISHDAAAGSLDRARKAHIPFAYVPITDRRSSERRQEHETALIDTIQQYRPELIVLAGWMLVLSGRLIEGVRCPIINVHPALLPVEKEPLDIPILRGAHAVRDALKLQLPYTGVSVHHVVAEVDAGPVIFRQAVSIFPDDDETSLHGRMKLVEHRLLVDAVNLLASGIGNSVAGGGGQGDGLAGTHEQYRSSTGNWQQKVNATQPSFKPQLH